MTPARRLRVRRDPPPEPAASTPDPAEAAQPETGAAGVGSRGALRELIGKIDDILETAERSASEMQHEAEEEAAAYLEERRREADRELERRRQQFDRELQRPVEATARLASSLRREAEMVLEHAEELARVAEDVLLELRESPGAADSRREEAPVPAPEPSNGGAREPERPGRGSEQFLLRAAQLAVAGTERDQIEEVLRTEFGISTPGPIVDEILGRDRSR